MLHVLKSAHLPGDLVTRHKASIEIVSCLGQFPQIKKGNMWSVRHCPSVDLACALPRGLGEWLWKGILYMETWEPMLNDHHSLLNYHHQSSDIRLCWIPTLRARLDPTSRERPFQQEWTVIPELPAQWTFHVNWNSSIRIVSLVGLCLLILFWLILQKLNPLNFYGLCLFLVSDSVVFMWKLISLWPGCSTMSFWVKLPNKREVYAWDVTQR